MNYFSAPGILKPKQSDISHVKSIILKYTDFTWLEMCSPLKTQRLSYARKLMFLYLRKNAKMSYSDIGRLLKRDHSTVMHGIFKLQQLSDVYPIVQQDINKLNEMI